MINCWLIKGQQGHEYTLKLNEAYKVLTRENLRKEYDASIGEMRGNYSLSSLGRTSSWNGPLRPQGLFVDENACIGRSLISLTKLILSSH